MPEYRRAKIAGGTFFFTVVTYDRLPILTGKTARSILRFAFLDVLKRFPFEIVAIVLLPNHIHSIWTLPEEDTNFSLRWKEIKRLFTKGYLEQVGPGERRNASRERSREAAVWQRRFWEHAMRDEKDLNRHIDYIHFNPVKHGLVNSVADWPWSSFHRYVRMGYYDSGWGATVEEEIKPVDGVE